MQNDLAETGKLSCSSFILIVLSCEPLAQAEEEKGVKSHSDFIRNRVNHTNILALQKGIAHTNCASNPNFFLPFLPISLSD